MRKYSIPATRVREDASSEEDSSSSCCSDDVVYQPVSSQTMGRGSKKSINKGRWSKEEDEKLKRLVQTYGHDDWARVSSFFADRTDIQCQQRWAKVVNPDLVKGSWSKEEDEKVVELVKKYGPKKWTLIAKHLKGRIGKQCRERWHNHLNPAIKKSAWTEEEERIIFQYHKLWGNQWAKIAKLLPGRTDNAIKNHWNSTLKKRVESETVVSSSSSSSQSKRKSAPAETVHIPTTVALAPIQIPEKYRHQASSSSSSLHFLLKEDSNKCEDVPHYGSVKTEYHTASSPDYSSYPATPVSTATVESSGALWQPEDFQAIQPVIILQDECSRAKSKSTPEYVDINDLLSPLKDINVEELESASGPSPSSLKSADSFGDLSALDLVDGTAVTPTVTPIKFTSMKQKTDHRQNTNCGMNIRDENTVPTIGVPHPVSKLTTPPILRRKRRRLRSIHSQESQSESEYSHTETDSSTHEASQKGERRFSSLEVMSVELLSGVEAQGHNRSPLSELNSVFQKEVSYPALLSPVKGNFGLSGQGDPDLLLPDSMTASALGLAALSPAKGTPVKPLPFSPSQFLNNPDVPVSSSNLTSTPVCSSSHHNLLQDYLQHSPVDRGSSMTTPKLKKFALDTPRTPTPFKDALAQLEKKGGPIKKMPRSPTLHFDDLDDLIEQNESSAFICDNSQTIIPAILENPAIPKHRSNKENVSPSKRVRKSLHQTWSTPGEIAVPGLTSTSFTCIDSSVEGFNLPETPSKSLLGDSSVLFSPPSIIRETLPEEPGTSLNDAFLAPANAPKLKQKLHNPRTALYFNTIETPRKPRTLKSDKLEALLCGKTQDQLELTEQARQWMNSLRPRSLNL